MSNSVAVHTGRRDVIRLDAAGVRSAAAELFSSNRQRARAIVSEAPSTPLGIELAKLFERERSIRGQP